MSLEIHWHEGLFLQPHHLQRMQRHSQETLCSERKLAWAYPYGVIEARLSRDDLENMRIRFERLRAVMPSGQIVSYPENAELPSLDVKQVLARQASFKIFLGVPLWQHARANTVASDGDTRAKLLYRIGEKTYTDENSGENSKPVQVRVINSRLMFEQEDPADMEMMPLLQVMRAAGQDAGLPRQDPDYVPPCLLLSGSPVLKELVRDLGSKVEAARDDLVNKMRTVNMEMLTGREIEYVMRLRTYNRFSARLPWLAGAADSTPFQLYLELRDLRGELAALKPATDSFATADYDHENPLPAFTELSTRIRDLMEITDTGVVEELLFEPINGFLTVRLNPDQATKRSAYLLRIEAGIEGSQLEAVVDTPEDVKTPDQFKLMPTTLIAKAIRGIFLRHQRSPPHVFRQRSNWHYFDLVPSKSERMWQVAQQEKSLSIRWQGNEVDLSQAKFTLCMTKPPGMK